MKVPSDADIQNFIVFLQRNLMPYFGKPKHLPDIVDKHFNQMELRINEGCTPLKNIAD